MRRITTLLLLTVLCLTAMAQGKLTMQAQMKLMEQKAKMERMEKAEPARAQQLQRITLVVSVDEGAMAAAVNEMKAAGAEVRARLGRQVVVSMPTDNVEALQRIEGVKRIDIGHKGKLKTDVAREETGVAQLNGTTLPAGTTAYTGKGVTVCLIDVGFDFQHPAFKDAEGRSRIKCVYMLNDNDGNKFTVGDPEIGEYTFPGSVYDTPELIAKLTTDNIMEEHGSHTAGISAGSISPMGFGGMAPEADIVLIPLNEVENEDGEEMGEDEIIETVFAFIAAYADQSQQPVVVSASLNSHSGPHDGTSTVTQALEELSNHVVPVFSAGNEGGYPIHLYQKFSEEQPSVKTFLIAMMENEEEEGHKYLYLPNVTGFVRKGDEVSIQLALKTINPMTGRFITAWSSEKCTAKPGCEEQMFISSSEEDATLAKNFDGKVGVGAMEDENGRLTVAAHVEGGWDNVVMWELTVSGSDGTEVDLWDDSVGFGGVRMVGLKGYVDGDNEMSAGDWTCTDRVISVGAYCTNVMERRLDGTVVDTSVAQSEDAETYQKDEIASFSSFGTSFNGVQQPLICAPGVNIVSSLNHFKNMGTYADGMQWDSYPYGAMTGTSMACPVVSGIVALWLQAKPDMKLDDVKNVLSQTSRNDEYTQDDAEGRWGYGKIDAAAGIKYILDMPVAIRNVDFVSTTTDAVYDLQGRRVNDRPAPGLYIKNGRKVVIR